MHTFNRSRRSSVRRAALETLERRLVLDATYHPLASTPFTQDWSDISLITTNDDWSGVPSIIGYRGDGLTSSAGVDPQTVVASSTVIDVNANQTNPNTFATGGVTEFHITNPVVALSGSATARAPYIQLHINSTGVPNVRVSYLLRDIDGSGDDAVQAVALQYRVGETGNFINVPAGFVPDASTGPNQATLETPVSVVLPNDAGNQAQLQVRIITTDAVGSDEWIGVDDIVVQSADPSPGALGFAFTSYTVNEAAGTASIGVVRVGGSLGAVSVRYQTVAGGTATPGLDYTPVDDILNFADGQVSRSFTISIVNDTEPEPTETINLLLSDPTGGASIGQATAVLSIIDNDSTPPTGVVLNELNVNPPGDDGPFEYVEVRGAPGQSLFKTYFVSIEGDSPNTGSVTLAVDLDAFALGSNGLLMIKATSGGFTPPSETTVVGVSALNATAGALQNGSNSFALIFSPTPITLGADLDINDDGFLDLPSGATLVDGVGWLDGGALDLAYGAVLTQPTGAPHAATRFPDDLTPLSFDAWFNGWLVNDAGNASVTYNQTNGSANLPPGAVLTPGAPNFAGDAIPPEVTDGQFVFDAYPTLQTLTLTFSENVSASLNVADDITLLNLTTATPVPSTDIALSYNLATNIASLTFPNYPNGVLPDGNYVLTLAAESVEDAAGNKLVEAYNLSFFVFGGDANRDRTIGIADFSIVGSNFNQPGTYSTGDFNYDGIVNIADFSTLAAKFNTSLPEPAGRGGSGSALASAPARPSPFGTTRISDDVLPA